MKIPRVSGKTTQLLCGEYQSLCGHRGWSGESVGGLGRTPEFSPSAHLKHAWPVRVRAACVFVRLAALQWTSTSFQRSIIASSGKPLLGELLSEAM